MDSRFPINYETDNQVHEEAAGTDTLWFHEDMAKVEARWNKYFPYQLLIVKAEHDPESGETTYFRVPKWQYTLPIPPQEMVMDMPIATQVKATLGGISETHGGAPFRTISLQGTTGITPKRGRAAGGTSADAYGEPARSALGILAGTVQAVQRTGEAAVATFAGTDFNAKPNMLDKNAPTGPGANQMPAGSTGYYQYQMLERFMEAYVQLKSKNQTLKNELGDTRKLRLALAVWKDNAVYLCSGVQLTKRKSATDPYLINFNLQLRAWARVELHWGGSPAGSPRALPTVRSPTAQASMPRPSTGCARRARYSRASRMRCVRPSWTPPTPWERCFGRPPSSSRRGWGWMRPSRTTPRW
jgi:hypothetical protein